MVTSIGVFLLMIIKAFQSIPLTGKILSAILILQFPNAVKIDPSATS
jgi:hypothetical protein